MRRRAVLRVALDLVVLVAVAGLLVAVHELLPAATQARFAFDHGAPRPLALVTAAYVHADDAHLVGNLLGYGTMTAVTYLVTGHLGRRRWFWWTSLCLFLLVPALVNLANYAVLVTWFPGLTPTNRGFSGVVAGFGGFLFVAAAVFVGDEYGRPVGVYVGEAAGLLVLALVTARASGAVSVLSAGLVLIGLVAAVFGVRLELRRGGVSAAADRTRRRVVADGLFAGSLFALVGILVYGLVPTSVVVNGRLTNVFAHAVGFAFGVVLALATAALDG
jgi:hypothetical protein